MQFGADCSLYAAAYGFSIEGDVGFDVLIQLLPFHFLAEFRASVQLKRGSSNLFKVSVDGALEGPLPLRVSGKASFEILWCDFSVHFDATLVDGGTPNDLVLIDVLRLLVDALAGRESVAGATAGSNECQLVGLRQPAGGELLLHPLGSLTVRQTVVPLGLDRDIDRVGTCTPSGDRRFSVTGTALGTKSQAKNSVSELFAPGQFFDLTDDDSSRRRRSSRWTPASRSAMRRTRWVAAKASPFDYTDIIIGRRRQPVLEPEPYRQDRPGARDDLRECRGLLAHPASGRETICGAGERGCAAIKPAGWVAAAIGGPQPTDAKLTWAEARGAAVGRAELWSCRAARWCG